MAEHLTVTPAGNTIAFEDGLPDPETGKAKRRQYLVDGEKLPSVTTVLGILDKPALLWWAEGLTVEGCITLAREGGLPVNRDGALSRLAARQLRHFQVSEIKAQRGHLSHDELVAFATGREPRPMLEIAPEDRGFVRGVAAFLADFRPTVTESELFVASPTHGYAGRLDLRATLGISTLPDGSPAPEGLGLLDLKSHDRFPHTKPSKTHPDGQLKTPYPEALLQLGLYEVAARESGYAPTDWRAVVRVDAQGNYDLTCSWLDPDDSLALLPAYRVFKAASSRVKSQADQRPVGFGVAA